jgi:hypothetical protein
MKKFALLLTMAFISSLAFGQSLVLNKHSDQLSGLPTDELVSTVTVTNVTGSPIDVKVRRIAISTVAGSDNWFCWDLCYDPIVNMSNGSKTIAANNGTNTDFTGHINNNGAEGVSVIKYCFYNVANQADSTCMEVTYNATLTGVADASAIKISNPYPNPANDNVTFNYSLPNANKAAVKIYNMLGALVKTSTITDPTGKLTINTSDLRSGLYLYDLQVNGRSMKTGKFTVTQ